MRGNFKYILCIITFLGAHAYAQDNVSNSDTTQVQTGIPGLNSSISVPDEFMSVWPRIPSDLQSEILDQVKLIREKKFDSRSLLTNYLLVIAAAKEVDGLDDRKLNDYLNMTLKTIESYDRQTLNKYLVTMKKFFEEKTLFHAKADKVYINQDGYDFEFVAEPEPEPIETVEEEPTDDYDESEEADDDEWFDDWDEEDQDDNWDTEWTDDEEEQELSDEEQLAEAIGGGSDLPIISGPTIKFDKATLNMVSSYDSVFLTNTSGTFLINSNQFVGNGGKFDWSSAGLSADSVYCKFTDYAIEFSSNLFSAQSVEMTYVGKVSKPIPGVFEYKSVRHDSTITAKYPRFKSYNSNIRINDFGKDITYIGGFSLEGSKINSSSVMGESSFIEVRQDRRVMFRARTKIFELQDSTLTTKRASVVIYQRRDSMYHPAVRFKFDHHNKNLTLEKDKGAFKNTPYSSTFYDLDFTADIMRWDLNSDSLDLSILEARRIVPAYFESSDHFNVYDYNAVGDKFYDFNPLGIVTYYADRNKTNQFYLSDLARQYKKDERLLKGAINYLVQKGLVTYSSRDNLVTVKPKAMHLFKSKRGRKDYDNIILKSVSPDKSNATLNFKKNELTVRGVESFRLSDSLKVVIVPDSSEMTFVRGRDFKFNGKIYAGNFEYIGRDFLFKYDSFLIHLNQIDSIEFFVQDKEGKGEKKINNALVSADNSVNTDGNLQGGSGTLYIDKPKNKSGRKKYPNYPRFKSGNGQVAYFDQGDVLDGAYDKSVYFDVPPFDLDSLDGSDPGALGFDGKFVSGGIFPPFEEELRIMDDYSLGFEHDIPTDGYQLYEGEGRMFSKLKLDKQGLRGNGRIEFLTTALESEDFVFYPDSVTGSGNFLEIRQEEYNGVIFPQVSLKDYSMKWLPKKDSMYIENIGEPISFYEETASLDGKAILSNNGVFGFGTLETRGSVMESDEISLEHNRIRARHSEFVLKSDNPEKPALSGDDVRISFNLDDNYALISPEVEGEAAIEFPYAQFKTSITEARWDLTEEKITMTKPDNVPIESSYFYTTREDLDSLRFNATKAEYDINTLELKVSGIPYIIVADAKITPENNEVLILENSKIGRLSNTTITLDTLNGYHHLTDGVIDIISRNEFTGYATYQFVNALGDTIPIQLHDFRLQEIEVEGSRKKSVVERHTVANGTLDEGENVLVSPGMYYKGDILLYAHKPAMELDGYVKLDLKEAGYNTWIKHASDADQHEVVINFDKATTEDGRRLEAGLHFSSGDNSLYSTFINSKFSPDDEDFFTPSGVLFFDEETQEFVIEDSLKAAGKELAGKIYRYNENTGIVQFEGRVDFFHEAKDIQVDAAVIGEGNLKENAFSANTILSLNFDPVPPQAFDIMAADISDVINNLGAPDGLGDFTQLLYKLADLSGERSAREYENLSNEEYVSLAGFTKETSQNLVFANIDIKWSIDHNAFYNEGKLGMSNIQKTDLNGAFDGFLELKRGDDGSPILNLFLKASPDSWYYFGYEDNRLLMFSSNNAFNNVISKKSNGAKAKIGDLVFAPADKVETLDFVNRFRLQYLGIEEPYELDAEVEESDDTEGTSEDAAEEEEDDDDGF